MKRKRKIKVDELPEFVLEPILQDDPLALAAFVTDCLTDSAHCEQLIGDPLHQLLLAKQSPSAEALAAALREEMATGEGFSFTLICQALRELGLRVELVPARP